MQKVIAPVLKLSWPYLILFVVFGVVVGLFSGFFGVGGGILIIPALVLSLGLKQQTAQGISLAFMVPVTLVGADNYFKQGATNTSHIPLMIALAVGGVLAIPFAVKVANALPQDTLKIFFALFITAVAVKIMPNAPAGVEVVAYNLKLMAALVGVLLAAVGFRLLFVIIGK